MRTLRAMCTGLLCLCLLFGGCAKQTELPQTTSEPVSVLEAFKMQSEPQTTEIPSEQSVSELQSLSEPSQTQTTANVSETMQTSTERQTQNTTVQQQTDRTTQLAQTVPQTTQAQKTVRSNEIRAVWISYLDLSALLKNPSESTFRAAAKEMVEHIRDGGMNTVFLQVRPASDAMYRSSIFPYSAYISGTEGKDPGYDALEVFCAYAKAAGVSVHAWINLFRVGDASAFSKKAESNPAKRILSDGDADNDSRIVKANNSLYYNPTDPDNQTLILDGIRELLQKYSIDGIHIDDYFYPTTDSSVDQKEYDANLSQGGTLSRGDWRRTQINALIARIFTCVKSFGQNKVFSISPALDIEQNRTTKYADITRWAAYDGYCDWLIPQVYVGFLHEKNPFEKTVAQWRALKRSANVRLLFGLAAYKSGVEDAYAGSGRQEWVERSDILSRQILYLRQNGGCDGFAFFSYAYCFGGKMSHNSILEMNSVISVL